MEETINHHSVEVDFNELFRGKGDNEILARNLAIYVRGETKKEKKSRFLGLSSKEQETFIREEGSERLAICLDEYRFLVLSEMPGRDVFGNSGGWLEKGMIVAAKSPCHKFYNLVDEFYRMSKEDEQFKYLMDNPDDVPILHKALKPHGAITKKHNITYVEKDINDIDEDFGELVCLQNRDQLISYAEILKLGAIIYRSAARIVQNKQSLAKANENLEELCKSTFQI